VILDKSGNPVSFGRVKLLDPASFLANCTPEIMEEYTMYMIAKKVEMMRLQSHEKGFVVRGVRILDLEGLGMSHMSSDMLKYLQNIVGPVNKNFPEHLYKMFIINAPVIFSMGWGIIKTFLPERSIKKISILGSDYRDALLEVIDEDQLPVQYGGKNELELWTNPEAEHKKTLVRAGNKLVEEYNLNAGDVLNWDFRTVAADIGFSVEFEPSSGGDKESIVGYSRIEAHKKIVQGEYKCPENVSGKVLITFDNSFSYWNGKELIYLITHTPHTTQ